ncbi:MAG: HEAT repeat domain-containing protein [Verrucomicrobiota bacterium]|nr:HEAT repeat domain-containing protein [Limisphaera sp.]MDW8380905.1 HEAT repeat domain-containing protein [Verrucomicrobiota bacterium]
MPHVSILLKCVRLDANQPTDTKWVEKRGRRSDRAVRSQWSLIALVTGILILSVFAAAQSLDTNNWTQEFRVSPGFQVQLVAAEPLVYDPVAITFDANGRLFVAEHRDFPEADTAPPHLGRIRLLTDTDGDGRMDVSHDFAEGLAAPSALYCWRDGILVAASHQIIFCQDTNRDGRSDLQQVVYTAPTARFRRSFGSMTIRSWAWGWDQRLHAAARPLGLQLLPATTEDPLSAGLDEHDLAFDPRNGWAAVESSFGSSAVAFDRTGCKLVAQPQRPLLQEMWRASHVDLAANYVLPPALYDLAGPLAGQALQVPSRNSTVMPSRRPRPRSPVWFSEVTALTVYGGALFPREYHNDVFVADARAGVIRRYKLLGDGPERSAMPVTTNQGEFLSGTHPWFRPVHLTLGPDGALYVVDLHREFVEPLDQLPTELHDRARLRRGFDRGRIYRIVPTGYRPTPPPRLEEAPVVEVMRALAHSNAWHRETAARLLCQREESAPLIPLLSNMLMVARSPLARQGALNVLGGLRALNPTILSRALQDTNEGVRLQAVRWLGVAAEPGSRLPESLWRPLRRLSADPSPWVRYELALLLTRYDAPQREIALVEVLRRLPESPYTRAAVLLALARNPGDAMALATLDLRLTRSAGGKAFLFELATLIGRLQYEPAIQQTLTFVQQTDDLELGLGLLAALQDGLRERGDNLARHIAEPVFRPIWERALLAADNRSLPVPVRMQAVRFLSAAPFLMSREVLAARLLPAEPPPLQSAALLALHCYEGSEAASLAVQYWPTLAPEARATAWRLWLARPESALALCDALEHGRLPLGAFPAWELNRLRQYPSLTVTTRAQKILGNLLGTNQTPRTWIELTNVPALGIPQRGRVLFEQRCSACHRFQGLGSAFGPDLEAAAMRGRVHLLERILNPDQERSKRAELRWIETQNSEYWLGAVVAENPAGIWFRSVDGQTLPIVRAQLRSISSLNRSIMPEGLLTGLTIQQVADLLAFVLASVPSPEELEAIRR